MVPFHAALLLLVSRYLLMSLKQRRDREAEGWVGGDETEKHPSRILLVAAEQKRPFFQA